MCRSRCSVPMYANIHNIRSECVCVCVHRGGGTRLHNNAHVYIFYPANNAAMGLKTNSLTVYTHTLDRSYIIIIIYYLPACPISGRVLSRLVLVVLYRYALLLL